MPNLTITASEEVLQRIRVEAAVHGQSVSRFVGEVLAERFRDNDAYDRAMAGFFARGPYLTPSRRRNGRVWPAREEIYNRKGLR